MSGYEHNPNKDPNLTGPYRAMKYDADGEPVLRVSIENIESNAGEMSVTSVTSAGQGSDIMARIDIANDEVAGHHYINKFGRRNVPAHLTNYYSITTQGEYDFPANTDTATVTSSNGGQDNGGTVEVAGLDANYNPVTETITVGQSGTQQFLRVHRAKMVTAGAGNDVNEGNITVEVDGETVAYIPEGYGQTLQAVYTVPAGYTAYIFQVDVGVDEKEKPVHARIQTRDAVLTNASWQTKAFIVMESNYISHKQTIPIRVPEKHDIVLQANSTAGDIEISGGFDLVMRANA